MINLSSYAYLTVSTNDQEQFYLHLLFPELLVVKKVTAAGIELITSRSLYLNFKINIYLGHRGSVASFKLTEPSSNLLSTSEESSSV